MKSKCILIFAFVIYVIIALSFSTTLCVFNNITGLPCFGCGLTRAYLSLLNGNITKAFNYHPLFPLPAIVAFILIYNKLKNNKFFINRKLVIIFLILISGLYIIRMILLFPRIEPMNINHNAIIPRILTTIRKVIPPSFIGGGDYFNK